MRKHAGSALLIAFCYVASVLGANTPPVLSGLCKIIFPENATPATIAASSGALTIAAGGSNKGVTLTTTGSGAISTAARLDLSAQEAARVNGGAAQWLVSFFNGAARQGYIGTNTGGAGMILNDDTGALVLQSTNTTVSGKLGVGAAPTTYPLEVTGDINASGAFRKNGVAGTGGNTLFTVCTSGACITSCTLQFNGGIRVGGTCP